jgi:hypothetical protein
MVSSLLVFLAPRHSSTHLLPHRVVTTDPVPARGNRGAWSPGTRGSHYPFAGPSRTRYRLAHDGLKSCHNKALHIELAAREIVARAFNNDESCLCGD